MARRERSPTYGDIARAVGRALRRKKRRAHGPLGLSVPGTDLGPRAGWKGGVIRRDPREYQSQSTIGLVRCPTCQHWRDESRAARCGTCGIFSVR